MAKQSKENSDDGISKPPLSHSDIADLFPGRRLPQGFKADIASNFVPMPGGGVVGTNAIHPAEIHEISHDIYGNGTEREPIVTPNDLQ